MEEKGRITRGDKEALDDNDDDDDETVDAEEKGERRRRRRAEEVGQPDEGAFERIRLNACRLRGVRR